MKKKPLLIILLFTTITTQCIYSQLNYLTIGTSNNADSYIDLGTNGSPIITSNFDDDNSAPQNIGFTFNYNGIAFTQFVLNTNGFIKLGNTNPSLPNLFYTTSNGNAGGVFNSTLPADVNILAVFNHDLQAGTGTAEYRVFTNGSPGSKVCTIQFKDVRDKNTSTSIQYDNMQFQIKLYETTNTVEFIYGSWTPSANSSSIRTAAIGLKGLDNTTAQLLVVGKVSSQNWSAASFTAGNYTGTNAFKFANPTKPQPDAGRSFRFIQALPNDATINLFTLGSIPIPYGAPRVDSAIVRNIGMNTLTNISVTLNITGANTFTDNQTVLSLASGAWVTIGFDNFDPSILGTNTVTVTLSNDDNNVNNTDTYSQIVNNTTFSYADTGKATGGIGANLPGYLVTKYAIIGTTSIAGATVFIAGDSASIGKSVYAIVFDDLNNGIDSSSAFTITAADTGKYHNFSFPQTPTINNASFYIGLAQTTTGYFPLGYQTEAAPVRLGAYFIRTMGVSNFTDLGGVNSLNKYRLMIQAIISNTTGVLKNINENTVLIYPNPFSNTTTFNIESGNTNACFYLYDVTGRVVKTIKNISTPDFKVERGNLQSGIYFYTLNDMEKIISSGKLVIE